MSQEYALSRVKDALEKSAGNHLKAQRLLLNMVEKDQTLLLGLIAPHINGIISHALAHVSSPAKKPAAKKVALKTDETSEFGNIILESLRGKRSETGSFGEATPKGINKPGKASKTHVDAINKLVSASKNKTGKK